jgi:hypothetical protein
LEFSTRGPAPAPGPVLEPGGLGGGFVEYP